MPFTSVTTQESWDAAVSALPWAQFTQSWAWGEFKKSRGQPIVRLASEGAAAFFHLVPAPFVGGYWYAPRGPVAKSAEAAQRFLAALAAERPLPGRSLFWRVESPFTTLQMPPGFVQSHAYMPASTLLIDVTQPEEVLQKAMHEKTRYNIRVAERRGVTVRVSTEDVDVETFLRLTKETAARDAFQSQPAHYIRMTFHALFPSGMVQIRLAEKEGRPLAASFEVRYGDTVTYLYGASSSAERNAMAPYALHWSALQDAKQQGYRFYDLHGVNPTSALSPYTKASWEGITRFKRGWGGHVVDTMGTWELPRASLSYRLFRFLRPI